MNNDNEKLPINKEPFKRIDYLRQPNSISLIQFRMELIQLRAYASYLEQLEPMFLELIDLYNKNKTGERKRISISETKSFRKHLNDDNNVEFKINLSDLRIDHSNYNKARETLRAMASLVVRVPVYKKDGSIEYQDSGAFIVRTTAENGKSRCNYVRLSMLPSVLDSFVDIRMGYHDQLKRIAFLSSSIYTARLYVLVTGRAHQNAQKLEIPLEDFRRFMGLIVKVPKTKETIRYKRYCDLERRVIIPAVTELKSLADSGNSDFWVDVDRKDVGELQNPSAFVITIHESKVSKHTRIEREKESEDRELLDLLYTQLKQSKGNVTKLTSRVTPQIRPAFIAEVRRAISFISNHSEIKKPSSYAWTMLDAWLDANAPEIEDVKPEDIEEIKAEPKEPIQQELFPTSDPRFEAFLSELYQSVGSLFYDTWIASMEFVSEENGTVTVMVPNYVVHEYIIKEANEAVCISLQKAFGNDSNLVFTYKNK